MNEDLELVEKKAIEESIAAVLKSMETIKLKHSEAIDVIRCKDCKYCDGGIDEDGKPFLKCLSGRSYGGTNADDYCSWAERKEEWK